MTQSRWVKIKELFNTALALPREKRAAYLDEQCATDAEMRTELDSLLREAERPDGFFSECMWQPALKALAVSDSMRLLRTSLDRYTIHSVLGRGGMGDVYLAHDRSLKRKVAIKILPDFLIEDQELVKRFQHEAQAASAISHPNVAHIYEIGKVDTRPFIAMEYVEGVNGARTTRSGSTKFG